MAASLPMEFASEVALNCASFLYANGAGNPVFTDFQMYGGPDGTRTNSSGASIYAGRAWLLRRIVRRITSKSTHWRGIPESVSVSASVGVLQGIRGLGHGEHTPAPTALVSQKKWTDGILFPHMTSSAISVSWTESPPPNS